MSRRSRDRSPATRTIDDRLRVSRPFDSNRARRELRRVLLEVADTLALPAASVPHSYDSSDLLSAADKAAGRRGLGTEPELRAELFARIGIAACLEGQLERGRRAFERGRRAAEDGPERARFTYLSAVYGHAHRGDHGAAKRELEDALADSELARRLRTEIRIALGRACLRLGDRFLAEEHLSDVLELGVTEYHPVALHELSRVHLTRGEFAEAKRLATAALADANPVTDPTLPFDIRTTLADVAFASGNVEGAARLYESTAAEQDRMLAIEGAARSYRKLGTARRALGRHGSALDAFGSSIRFYTITGHEARLSEMYERLGGCFVALADGDAARGAYALAVSRAIEAESPDLELAALCGALHAPERLGLSEEQVSQALGRCKQLVQDDESALSPETLRTFARVVLPFIGSERAIRTRRRSPALGSESMRLARFVVRPNVLERAFDAALPDELGIRWAPPREAIRSFLLLFTGDRFKHADYAGEFLLSPGHAKRHLKELRERGVLELRGQRKGSAYTLSFHR